MRGFIFTEFVEMVEETWGVEVADRLTDECELESGGAYTAADVYATSEIVALVSKLSEVVDMPVPTLLQVYGRSLFEYLARSHHRIMEGIDHPFELFRGLEQHVHTEVRKLYPNAEVPYFDCADTGAESMRLRYKSSRAMPDLAEGLIHGACAHFGREVDVRREDRSGGAGSEVDFFVTLKDQT